MAAQGDAVQIWMLDTVMTMSMDGIDMGGWDGWDVRLVKLIE